MDSVTERPLSSWVEVPGYIAAVVIAAFILTVLLVVACCLLIFYRTGYKKRTRDAGGYKQQPLGSHRFNQRFSHRFGTGLKNTDGYTASNAATLRDNTAKILQEQRIRPDRITGTNIYDNSSLPAYSVVQTNAISETPLLNTLRVVGKVQDEGRLTEKNVADFERGLAPVRSVQVPASVPISYTNPIKIVPVLDERDTLQRSARQGSGYTQYPLYGESYKRVSDSTTGAGAEGTVYQLVEREPRQTILVETPSGQLEGSEIGLVY